MRLLAATQLKNGVEKTWSTSKFKLSKTYVRESLLPIILQSQDLIRKQLYEVIDTLVRYDYPSKMPKFLPQVKQLLEMPDITPAYIGLRSLYPIVDKYYDKPNKKLDDLLTASLAVIIPRVQAILQQPDFTNNTQALFLKVFCGILTKSLRSFLRESLSTPDRMKVIIQVVLEIVLLPIPESAIVWSPFLCLFDLCFYHYILLLVS